MVRQVLDDDARLRNGHIPCLVMQNRKLADRPDPLEFGARPLAAEVHNVRLERRIILIKSDQDLPAERRQGMKIELQRHANAGLMAERSFMTTEPSRN